MALDEALLEAMPRLGRPALRFYSWTEPAASFGYFQKIAVVESLTSLRPLVRRPTGGGIVPHDADWTYSVAVPVSDPWYDLPAIESYRRIHEWISASFALLGLPTEVAPAAHQAAVGQCFAGWEKFDLLWRGRKIAGAAQRRTRAGLLIQGSVQPPRSAGSRQDWERAMCEAGRDALGYAWADFQPDATFDERTQSLARDKYSQAAYNRRR
jgi:lipoate-protein ligase A